MTGDHTLSSDCNEDEIRTSTGSLPRHCLVGSGHSSHQTRRRSERWALVSVEENGQIWQRTMNGDCRQQPTAVHSRVYWVDDSSLKQEWVARASWQIIGAAGSVAASPVPCWKAKRSPYPRQSSMLQMVQKERVNLANGYGPSSRGPFFGVHLNKFSPKPFPNFNWKCKLYYHWFIAYEQ